MKPWKVGEKVPKVGAPQNNAYVCIYLEYCAMVNLGGKF
jgi:hypothetical protein